MGSGPFMHFEPIHPCFVISIYLFNLRSYLPLLPRGLVYLSNILLYLYIYIYIYIFTLCAYLPLQPGFMVHLSNLNPGFHAFQIKPLSLQQIWATIVMGVKCPFYRQ